MLSRDPLVSYKMVLQDAKADREAKVYLPGARLGIRVFLKKQ